MVRSSLRTSLVLVVFAAIPAAGQSQTWIKQFGTSNFENSEASSPDGSGGLYVNGTTAGSLGGPFAGGFYDSWLAHYDSAGNQTWIRQLGTSGDDVAPASAPDGSGGVYVSGWTTGSLGGASSGGMDAWLARYDMTGTQLWIRQTGTSGNDQANTAASDGSGGVYVSGGTTGSLGGPSGGGTDAWLARYDMTGNQTWIRQFGMGVTTLPSAAAPDGLGGVYVSGENNGGSGSDAWLAHYDVTGTQLWIRLLGTGGNDNARLVAADGLGGAYVGGNTDSSLGGPASGAFDAWLAHYNSVGNQTWIRQIGTSADDYARTAGPDNSGGVYVSGGTLGSLGGASAGSWDIWVARYDSAGTQTWIRQFGTSALDGPGDIEPDASGGFFLCGWTQGSLGGPSAGASDVWLALFDPGCSETTYCTAKVNSLGCTPAIAWTGSPSAAAISGFDVSCAQVRNNKPGILMYSVTGRSSLLFQGGILCVANPIRRTPGVASGGSPFPANDCSGIYSLDMSAFAAGAYGGSPLLALRVPGTVVDCQWWGRDQGASFSTTLSDALEYSVCP